jgi:hypothetical protein
MLMQRDAWYVRGVSYAILTLGNSCSVLPSIETFHSTTTEKTFTYSRILPYMRLRGT